jgi:L-lactate utilization protein LutB
MDLEKTIRALRGRGFTVSHFASKEEAADYLAGAIQNTTVGMGGSKTLDELGVYDRLCENNQVFWHWREPGIPTLDKALTAQTYLSSANAITEDGQIINIDGRGNRLGAMVYGPGKDVYIVAGVNKIAPDFDSALFRARNTAAVQNIARFAGSQPCQNPDKGGKCYDCRAKDRCCNALLVLWGKLFDMQKLEVVLIDEELGL